jgi:LacI family transcriptional regulator
LAGERGDLSGEPPRVRSYEVARLAGVHRSTVSRALNPSTAHLVNAQTRRRVEAAVEQLSYRTDAIAQSLRTRRSLTIGFLIPDITNPIFARIVRGSDDTLHRHGYGTLVGYGDDQPSRAGEELQRLEQRGVDGFIVATAQRSDPALERLADRGVPVVLVNRRTDDDRLAAVTVDDQPGTEAAVRHLAELGHARVACIAAPQSTSTGRARLTHFRQAMDHVELAIDDRYLVEAGALAREATRRLVLDLLDLPEPPTAIVAANDIMAIGCLEALRVRGLRCPDDVSVVGFNDMPYADWLSPALTTVHWNHYDMGATAARILLAKLGVISAELEEHVLMPSHLVVRQTTGPAPDRPARARPPASAPVDDLAGLGARIASLEAATLALIDEMRASGA